MRQYTEPESRLTPENNHQILTVFFIVAGLLGVFFTLGYVVGRNSPLFLGPSTASAHEIESKPAPETASRPSIPPASAPISRPPLPPVETAKVIPPPAAAAKAEKPAAPPVQALPSSAPPATAGDRPSGTYLQLVATSKQGVDVMVDALRTKGFKAVAAEIPEKRGWFRALVGPLADSGVSSTRADLQTAGFPGDKAIKKNF